MIIPVYCACSLVDRSIFCILIYSLTKTQYNQYILYAYWFGYFYRLLEVKFSSDQTFIEFCNLRKGKSGNSLDSLLYLPVSTVFILHFTLVLNCKSLIFVLLLWCLINNLYHFNSITLCFCQIIPKLFRDMEFLQYQNQNCDLPLTYRFMNLSVTSNIRVSQRHNEYKVNKNEADSQSPVVRQNEVSFWLIVAFFFFIYIYIYHMMI